MRRILLDLDDTVVDMCYPFTELYNKLYDDSLSTSELFLDWEIHHRAKCGEEIYKLFHTPGFFLGLQPKENAVSAIQLLRHIFHINIVTSISRSSNAARDKVLWVKKHLPFYDIADMFMCKRKELIDGDIMIDDSSKNLEKWRHKGITVLFEAPHNRNSRHVFDYDVSSWDQILGLLGDIFKGDEDDGNRDEATLGGEGTAVSNINGGYKLNKQGRK